MSKTNKEVDEVNHEQIDVLNDDQEEPISPEEINDSSVLLYEYGIQSSRSNINKSQSSVHRFPSLQSFAGTNFLMLDKSENAKKDLKELKQFLKRLKPIILTNEKLDIYDRKLVNYYKTGIMNLASYEDDIDDKIPSQFSETFRKELASSTLNDSRLKISKIFLYSNQYYDTIVRNIDEIKKLDIAKGIAKLMELKYGTVLINLTI